LKEEDDDDDDDDGDSRRGNDSLARPGTADRRKRVSELVRRAA